MRIAPSTYALRSSLRGGVNGPVPQQRTSSGSISSQGQAGRPREGAVSGGQTNSGSGHSTGAVAGGRCANTPPASLLPHRVAES